MREKFIKLTIEMNAQTALRIARCIKRNEPKIYKVLVKEIKQALIIPIVVSSGNPKPKHKGKWKCKLCGRDTFDTKTPHKCVSGYTKRGLIWEEVE
jgi:rubrerythrin